MKAILLLNDKKNLSVPLAHAENMKENNINMKLLLEIIEYSQSSWNLYSNVQSIARISISISICIISNFVVFLCERDSRARDKQYVVKNWPRWTSLIPGVKNVSEEQLVQSEKFFPPPLHIRLGIVKHFVKTMSKDSGGNTLRHNFCESASQNWKKKSLSNVSANILLPTSEYNEDFLIEILIQWSDSQLNIEWYWMTLTAWKLRY